MEKLLAIVSLGQNIYGRWLFQRFLSSLIVLASLIIVASMMASAVLIGGFYAAYHALLYLSVAPQVAMAVIGGVLLLTTILFILFIAWYLRRLRTMPRRLLSEKIPAVSSANEVVDAFLKGLLDESTSPS